MIISTKNKTHILHLYLNNITYDFHLSLESLLVKNIIFEVSQGTNFVIQILEKI